jgi:glycosyltransferase involved in cell wall biosynthesis
MAWSSNAAGANTCIVLPYTPAWSETFLQAHVDRLQGVVRYIQQFPVDVDSVFDETGLTSRQKLQQSIRAGVHRYILNPAKKAAIRRFFRSNRVDVVLAEYGLTGARVLRACKKAGIPLVVHFHGYDAYEHAVLDRHRETYKEMFNYSSAIIAVSKHMTQQLIGLGASPKKVIYNAYGVELDKFMPAMSQTRLQVIAVGRFVEKKAPYLTILAFKKVLERLPDARLIMIGTGMLRDVCFKLIKALHIEHAVDLKGVASHGEVAALMQQSRVFVQHSLVPASGDMEGTPLVVLEAAASGLPVVATRHAGICDAVVHEETGFLVAEGDIDAMADYMHLLLVNPELARDMGRKGREHIGRHFDVEQSIGALRKVLAGVARKPA